MHVHNRLQLNLLPTAFTVHSFGLQSANHQCHQCALFSMSVTTPCDPSFWLHCILLTDVGFRFLGLHRVRRTYRSDIGGEDAGGGGGLAQGLGMRGRWGGGYAVVGGCNKLHGHRHNKLGRLTRHCFSSVGREWVKGPFVQGTYPPWHPGPEMEIEFTPPPQRHQVRWVKLDPYHQDA